MKFGLRYCNIGRYVDPAKAVELVQAGEAAGFESAWTVEHTVVPDGYRSAYPYTADGKMPGGTDDFPLPDPLIWMAYMAAMTSRIKLATGILILPQRNPVITAKQVATIDHMSGGRVLLGIGVGWMKEEFDAIGASFHDRGRRTDEYVAALRFGVAHQRSKSENQCRFWYHGLRQARPQDGWHRSLEWHVVLLGHLLDARQNRSPTVPPNPHRVVKRYGDNHRR
jgi:alkanesulfonate monooxygenase SsuD/methylene tetrahydromethanopterin reductase-like flavin-dependent oxidoreductase (luciferase family)